MSSIWTIRRSATDTKVAGLCGGVAEHWGIDPVLVRVGWVLLALSGGVGAVLYLAGWLLIPLAGQTTAPADDLLGEGVRRWPRGVWLLLVAAACVVVLITFGALTPFGVGPAVILACVWYFGFYRGHPARPAPPTSVSAGTAPPATPSPAAPSSAGPASPFTEAADAWRRRIQEHTSLHAAHPAATSGSASTTWPVLPAMVPTTARSAEVGPDPEIAERSAFLAEPDPVGLYTSAADEPAPQTTVAARPPRGGDRLAARRLRLSALAVLGLALAGLGFADQSGVRVGASVYAATALLVVGLTLVLSTWLGRARGLLPLGLLLVPVVLATTVLGPVTHLDRWTMKPLAYASVGDLPLGGDQLEAGQLTVDLSRLPSTTNASYTAHVGTGQLVVVPPPGSNVVLDYQVGFGGVKVAGQQVEGGSKLIGSTTAGATAFPAGTLTLHLSADFGQVEVR